MKDINKLSFDMHDYEEPNELISGWGVDIPLLCEAIEKGEI